VERNRGVGVVGAVSGGAKGERRNIGVI